MRDNKMLEFNEILIAIEVGADKIALRIDAGERSINSLKRIKDCVLTIMDVMEICSDEEKTGKLPLLKAIYRNIKMAIAAPTSIEFVAERIEHFVDEYLSLQHPFEEEYEEGLDKDLQNWIEAQIITNRKQNIAREQSQILNSNLSADSPEFKLEEIKYNAKEYQKNTLDQRLDYIKKGVETNAMIVREKEKDRTLSDVMERTITTPDEFADMAYINKDMEVELNANYNAFKEVAKDIYGQDACQVFDDSAFVKALEETQLEALYKADKDGYAEKILSMQSKEYLHSMQEIMSKMDLLAQGIATLKGEQQAELLALQKHVEELFSTTNELSKFKNNVEGDIEAEIQYCLDRNPSDLKGANLILRSCIENYCRWVHGVDLNDKLILRGCETAVDKMKFAQVDEACVKDVAAIYTNSNKFIHTDLKTLKMSELEKKNEAKRILESLAIIKDWKIDRYDIETGVPHYYKCLDNDIKNMIDDGMIDVDTLINDKQITYYFDKIDFLYQFMQKHGYEIPDIKFKRVEDIATYMGVTLPKRMEGYICEYDKEKEHGKIAYEENKIFFYLSGFKNKSDCKKNARVTFVIKEDKIGRPIAKDIRAIAVAEEIT